MTHPIGTPTQSPVKTLALTGAGLALALGLAACTTLAPDDARYDDQPPYSDAGDYSVDSDIGSATDRPAYTGSQVTRPRRIAGAIEARDFSASGAREREGRSALFHLSIATDGRVTDCRAHESSGIAALDDFTCRLILQRFRYDPARDAQGRPVPGIAGWQQRWYTPTR